MRNQICQDESPNDAGQVSRSADLRSHQIENHLHRHNRQNEPQSATCISYENTETFSLTCSSLTVKGPRGTYIYSPPSD